MRTFNSDNVSLFDLPKDLRLLILYQMDDEAIFNLFLTCKIAATDETWFNVGKAGDHQKDEFFKYVCHRRFLSYCNKNDMTVCDKCGNTYKLIHNPISKKQKRKRIKQLVKHRHKCDSHQLKYKTNKPCELCGCRSLGAKTTLYVDDSRDYCLCNMCAARFVINWRCVPCNMSTSTVPFWKTWRDERKCSLTIVECKHCCRVFTNHLKATIHCENSLRKSGDRCWLAEFIYTPKNHMVNK